MSVIPSGPLNFSINFWQRPKKFLPQSQDDDLASTERDRTWGTSAGVLRAASAIFFVAVNGGLEEKLII